MPQKVLIAFNGTLQYAPRPSRFISFCRKQNYNISLACSAVSEKELQGITSFTEISSSESGRYSRIVLKLLRFLMPFSLVKERINIKLNNLALVTELVRNNEYDLIYFADIYLLPILVRYKKGAKIIFDAREYYPLQFEDNINFNLFEKNERIRLLKNNLESCDKVITVSEGLATAYLENFNVLPEVILSLPNYFEKKIKNSSEETIKILYHGMANRNRKIENFIGILQRLKIKAELHLYLVGDQYYIDQLKEGSKNNPAVHFHEPVAFADIVHTVNNYDVGICYFEPTTFNLKHCLPNKFFEYIQARLVVAIGPSPDMEKIIKEHKCGIISTSFTVESMADSLNTLSREKINNIKNNSDIAAKYYCFENEENKLSIIVSTLLNI